jgi:hypothetical protein
MPLDTSPSSRATLGGAPPFITSWVMWSSQAIKDLGHLPRGNLQSPSLQLSWVSWLAKASEVFSQMGWPLGARNVLRSGAHCCRMVNLPWVFIPKAPMELHLQCHCPHDYPDTSPAVGQRRYPGWFAQQEMLWMASACPCPIIHPSPQFLHPVYPIHTYHFCLGDHYPIFLSTA